jgi:hypothetical protein
VFVPGCVEHFTAEIHQDGIESAAAELNADRVGAFRVQLQQCRGLSAKAAALARYDYKFLPLEIANNLPGGILGEFDLPGEVGF